MHLVNVSLFFRVFHFLLTFSAQCTYFAISLVHTECSAVMIELQSNTKHKKAVK